MNKFKIGLISLSTTLFSGCFHNNEKIPNKFFLGEFGGIHPAQSYEDKNVGYLYLLDSTGIKIDSFNIELDSAVCSNFRPKLNKDSIWRTPNRVIVGESEVKVVESEKTGNDTIIFKKIIRAKAVNPKELSYWQNMVDSANTNQNREILFGR